MSAFINVALVTALCLLLPVTRIYGVIGVGILLYFKFALTLSLLIVSAISYFTFRRFLS